MSLPSSRPASLRPASLRPASSRPASSLSVPEPVARALTLAQAVETSDARGLLLSIVEREAIDRQVIQSARTAQGGVPADVGGLLRARADHVLQVVENRSPVLAALRHCRPLGRWLAVATPLAAIALGAATDRIANPHRVDLLSLPLLAILAFNLAVYAALLLAWVLQRPARKPSGPSPVAALAQRLAHWHPRVDALHARVMAAFSQKWFAATAALQAQRVRKVLHLAAAGWALGIVLSLFARGLVVEYRVGWESTFLDARQVHAILRVLLAPALWLLPFEPFSSADIAALRFGDGTPPAGGAGALTGAVAGPRWVYLYASLLALVVMLPRLALALWARWRERQLAGHVTLSIDNAYYRRIVAMTNPTHVHLGIISAQDRDHAALLRVLQPRALAFEAQDAAPHGHAMALMRASSGEALFAERMAPASRSGTSPLSGAQSAASRETGSKTGDERRAGWAGSAMARLRSAGVLTRTSLFTRAGLETRNTGPAHAPAAPYQPQDGMLGGMLDAVLLVLRSTADLDAALPQLHALASPMLLLVESGAGSSTTRAADLTLCRTRARTLQLDAEVLGFDSFARCWVQQPVLFDAIGRCLPTVKKEGFARLLETRMQRQQARFAQSMQAIASQLLAAARDVEAVRAAPLSVTRFIKSADRQADAEARGQATAALVERLQQSARQTQATLLRLHGIDTEAHGLVEQTFEEAFRHTAPVNARQAGMAGAATGAATGASVDLITGGLTLGAAAALGALLGGGAAMAGAAWKNRSTPTGAATVQLGDEMLHALLDAALLRYLTIVHLEGGADAHAVADAAHQWPQPVALALAPQRSKLAASWALARQAGQPPPDEAFGQALQGVMLQVLHTLYPTYAAPPVPTATPAPD